MLKQELQIQDYDTTYTDKEMMHHQGLTFHVQETTFMITVMLETSTGVEIMEMMKEFLMITQKDLHGEYIQVVELLTTINTTEQILVIPKHLMVKV